MRAREHPPFLAQAASRRSLGSMDLGWRRYFVLKQRHGWFIFHNGTVSSRYARRNNAIDAAIQCACANVTAADRAFEAQILIVTGRYLKEISIDLPPGKGRDSHPV